MGSLEDELELDKDELEREQDWAGLGPVKEVLPEGSFGPWLQAEFGWSEGTARRFMAAAERLGGQAEEPAGESGQGEEVPPM